MSHASSDAYGGKVDAILNREVGTVSGLFCFKMTCITEGEQREADTGGSHLKLLKFVSLVLGDDCFGIKMKSSKGVTIPKF